MFELLLCAAMFGGPNDLVGSDINNTLIVAASSDCADGSCAVRGGPVRRVAGGRCGGVRS